MRKHWVIAKHNADAVNKLANELGVRPLISALLIARGYDTAASSSRFLNPSSTHLHEPLLLKGMAFAVDRIQRAVENREKILIWGDYDVDGTTGTVLLREMLSLLGAESGFHVPDRFTEGYGINIPALEKAKADGYSLVISVDCGTTAVEEIDRANSIGLDVIITDHHLPRSGEKLPLAVALINPNQPDCPYPDKDLAGVGVAFKLAHALLREYGLEREVPRFLKIAAIGTVADVVHLTGENRAIVALGLTDLPKTENFGLKALMEISDCRSEMTSYHIGFRIGPRINAAGRMDVARHVIELFESTNFNDARRLAALLDSRNRDRQKIQQEITDQALKQAEENGSQRFIIVSGEGWHKGVIGLAASRIAERLHRPAIVITTTDGIGYGSARSIPGFHLLRALESCSDLFEKFGGHAAAAGLTIDQDRIPLLRQRLNEFADESLLEEQLFPVLNIDALVTTQTLGLDLVNDLALFEPFGAGNPKPVFVTRGLVLTDDPYVMKEKHLKLKLIGGQNQRFEAVWWDGVERCAGQTLRRGSRIELAYLAEANVWQGNTRLQLVVQDLRADN